MTGEDQLRITLKNRVSKGGKGEQSKARGWKVLKNPRGEKAPQRRPGGGV